MDCVLEPVIMMFGWCRIQLGEFDACIGDVWAICCHGPDQLANAGAIFNLHLGGEGAWSEASVELTEYIKLFEPCGVSRKQGGAVYSEWDFTKPCVKVLLTEFPNAGMAVKIDVVACLCDVNTVDHVKEALLLEGHG